MSCVKLLICAQLVVLLVLQLQQPDQMKRAQLNGLTRVRTCKFALRPVHDVIHFPENGECHERRFLVDRGAAFASEALLSEAEGETSGR